MRVFFNVPNKFGTYWVELRHFQKNRLVESIADRHGVEGKAAAIEAVRHIVLAAEESQQVKAILHAMRMKVIAELEAHDPPPTEMEMFMTRAAGAG